MNQELIGYISQTQELNCDIREGGVLEVYDLEYDIRLVDIITYGHIQEDVDYSNETIKVKELLNKLGGLT